jgi:hypothetical protein
LLALDIQCQRPENYLVHLNILEFCNSACVVPIGKTLHVFYNDDITVKVSTIQVKSLCGTEEGTVDRDSAIFVPNI